jgi:hypothetical protein
MYRLNTLLRIKSVVNEYKKYEHPGVPAAYIWREYIFPTYHISLSTFYDYLGTPVDRLLKARCNKPEEPSNQLKIPME